MIDRLLEIVQSQGFRGHDAMLNAGACVSPISRYPERRVRATYATAGQYRREDSGGVLLVLSSRSLRP